MAPIARKQAEKQLHVPVKGATITTRKSWENAAAQMCLSVPLDLYGGAMDLDTRVAEDLGQHLAQAIADVFELHDITTGYPRDGVVRLRGRFRVAPREAYDVVGPRFRQFGYTALFRKQADDQVILAEPGVPIARRLNPVTNLVLFLFTVASVIFAGLFFVSPVQTWSWSQIWPGLAFSGCLMAILVAHEMGHYLVARHVGVHISLPYFIPFPFSFFGTMGAAELMQGRPRDRRALLAVGSAGPLAGIVLALPTLILGLALSEVGPIPQGVPLAVEGNSLLYLALKFALFGRILPGGGYDVFIHPIAFAGWGGLLVTALNLIPVGQLDGGHIIYALLGKRVSWLIWPVLVALIILGIWWWPWYLWAGMLFFLGRIYAEPLDDLSPLTAGERALGILMLVILALVFVPVPFRIG